MNELVEQPIRTYEVKALRNLLKNTQNIAVTGKLPGLEMIQIMSGIPDNFAGSIIQIQNFTGPSIAVNIEKAINILDGVVNRISGENNGKSCDMTTDRGSIEMQGIVDLIEEVNKFEKQLVLDAITTTVSQKEASEKLSLRGPGALRYYLTKHQLRYKDLMYKEIGE